MSIEITKFRQCRKNTLSELRYLTPQEAAGYLAISLRTMRTLLSKREIPYVQAGGKGSFVRIDIEDIDAFMARNKVQCVS